MASYYKALRILLQPQLYVEGVRERYLELCAEACRGVCETYKRLHTKLPVCFTSLSLQSVFLAGKSLPIHLQAILLTDIGHRSNPGVLHVDRRLQQRGLQEPRRPERLQHHAVRHGRTLASGQEIPRPLRAGQDIRA